MYLCLTLSKSRGRREKIDTLAAKYRERIKYHKLAMWVKEHKRAAREEDARERATERRRSETERFEMPEMERIEAERRSKEEEADSMEAERRAATE